MPGGDAGCGTEVSSPSHVGGLLLGRKYPDEDGSCEGWLNISHLYAAKVT